MRRYGHVLQVVRDRLGHGVGVGDVHVVPGSRHDGDGVAGRGQEGISFPGDDHDRQVDGVEESLETVAGRPCGGAAEGIGHRPGDASSTKVAGRGLVDRFGGAIESGVDLTTSPLQ